MKGPVEIEGTGSFPTAGACDTATEWNLRYSFAGGLTMEYRGVQLPSNDDQGYARSRPFNDEYGPTQSHGTLFVGTEGWVRVDRAGIRTHPESLVETRFTSADTRLLRSDHHVRNFLEAVRSRERTVCPVDEAAESDIYCHLGEIAIRLDRKVTWNTERENLEHDREATQLMNGNALRSPWKLT
jgi:hypothetical protein